MIKSFGNITAHGITYKAPAVPPADLFWIDPKGHENFWCSVLGGTSGSSSSPRTEMRETQVDQPVAFNWPGATGRHKMSGTVRVEKAPSSGKVIVGQIHAEQAPNPFLMVTWWNGKIRIDLRDDAQGEAVNVVSLLCPLSKAFKFSLDIEEGILFYNLNGQQGGTVLHESWDAFPFYFKRGAYVIDHEGTADEGGWVVYEESAVSHE